MPCIYFTSINLYYKNNMEFINCFGDDDDKKTNQDKKKPRPEFNSKKEREFKQLNGAKKKRLSESRTTELSEKLLDIKLDTDNVKVLEYKNYKEEIDYGNIEYKLKLNNVPEKRLEKLVSQMQFRLREGNGECFYEIGVEDNGNPLGLNKDELEESLKTLYLMTQKINAKMTILNYRDGKQGLIGEILIIKEEKVKKKLEIKVGLVGEESCGKSTLVGCLVTGSLDNGKGMTRQNVFRHKHEIICGKTSSLSHQIVGFNESGKMTNNSVFGGLSWSQIVDKSAKIVNFYDLGGSEKSLKTTIKALSPNYLDYLCIVVSASSGVTNETMLFLNVAFAMDLPIFITVTKLDLLSSEDQYLFLKNLNYVIKAQKKKKNSLVAKNQEDIVMFSRMLRESIVPIFLISNTTGQGMDLLINFLNILPLYKNEYNTNNTNNTHTNKFDIHDFFTVDSTKLILMGIVNSGKIEKESTMLLGPDNTGKYKKIEVSGLHCKKIDVKRTYQGQYCSICIEGVEKDYIRKGMVLIDTDAKQCAYRVFEAEMWNICSKEQKVKLNKTKLIISSGHIRQAAVCQAIEETKDGITNNFNTTNTINTTNKTNTTNSINTTNTTNTTNTLSNNISINTYPHKERNYSTHINKSNSNKNNIKLNSNNNNNEGEEKDFININTVIPEDEVDLVLFKENEPVKLRIEFCYNPEYLNIGDHLLILDFSFKSYGVVTKVIK